MGDRCETCRWFDNSTTHQTQPDTSGLCRVNPPVADDRSALARWPFVEDLDWCAKHEPEPPKMPHCTVAEGCPTREKCLGRSACPFDDIAF